MKRFFTCACITLTACSFDMSSFQSGNDGGGDALALDSGGFGVVRGDGGTLDTQTPPVPVGGVGGMSPVVVAGMGGTPAPVGGMGGMPVPMCSGECRPVGAACTPGQCASGHCIGDPGVQRCCDKACDGLLLACGTGYCEDNVPGYERRQRGSKTYLFVTARAAWRNWADAQTFCQKHGFNLVVVDDAEENAWLVANVPKVYDNRLPPRALIWLGLTNIVNLSQWLTVTGAPAPYTNWAPGQPDNYGSGENCASLILHDFKMPDFDIDWVAGTWNDRHCGSASSGFVCEK